MKETVWLLKWGAIYRRNVSKREFTLVYITDIAIIISALVASVYYSQLSIHFQDYFYYLLHRMSISNGWTHFYLRRLQLHFDITK